MAFMTKIDFYSLAVANKLVLTDTTENKTAQTATAAGEDGFVVATEVFGETSAPTENLTLIADLSEKTVKLGHVTTVGTNPNQKAYVLGGIVIETAAGSAVTITGNGQEVPVGSTDGCTVTYTIPNLSHLHHAQDFGAFTLSGTGAHLTQCRLSASGTINTATKDGSIITFDFTAARVEVSGTVQVSDSGYAAPTITPASGYKLTGPLTCTNPDADFPTYTFTLVKELAADVAGA